MDLFIRDNFTKQLLENDHFIIIFLYIVFVKIHDKKIWESQHDCTCFIKISVITRCIINGLHCTMINILKIGIP